VSIITHAWVSHHLTRSAHPVKAAPPHFWQHLGSRRKTML
jgi:hypothetical protein